MNMDTSRYVAGEFGAFEDEVLNAQWMPQPLQPEPRLHQAQEHDAEPRAAAALDVDAFLRAVYLSQE